MVVVIAVVLAIFLTSRDKGSVIDIAIPSKEEIFNRSSSIILGPKTSQNLYFHKSGWWIKKIEFRLPDFTGTDYELKALVTTKGENPVVEDWTEVGKKTFCLDKRDERLKDLILTINNNSASSTIKEEIRVFAMKEGCDEWSGSFKYEWEDKSEKKNERGLLQAIFTLKENSYGTEFVVQDGGYSFNFLGCSKESQTKTYTMIGDGNLGEGLIRLIPQDNGDYEFKIPAVWGRTDDSKEYIKRKNVCIYGKEPGDTSNTLEKQAIRTLDRIIREKWILSPNSVTGNLKGSKEFDVELEDGTKRHIKVSWDLVRQ